MRWPALSDEERFWSKVDKSADCWNWTACENGSGYGAFKVKRSTALAHRLAYELSVGPIPSGLQLDHICRNRRCVNPAHLEPVTQAENIRRGEAGSNSRQKTHCPRGHAYDEANTILTGGGRRRLCRTCQHARGVRRAAERKEARRLARMSREAAA